MRSVAHKEVSFNGNKVKRNINGKPEGGRKVTFIASEDQCVAKQSDISSRKGVVIVNPLRRERSRKDIIRPLGRIALSIAFDSLVASLKELAMLTAGELGWPRFVPETRS